MNLCPNCGSKDTISVYESETHVFLRCTDCYKMDTKRIQKDIRGKVCRGENDPIACNEFSGVINEKD